jgi:hypothetical protein
MQLVTGRTMVGSALVYNTDIDRGLLADEVMGTVKNFTTQQSYHY